MGTDMKKIVMVGPVYPYKGGIAHYTGLMFRALKKRFDVQMVSYKFQYPRLLFKKEQKDYTNDAFQIEETKYWLHTANPINCVVTALKINRLQPDMVILQWWHPYFAPCYWILTKCLRGSRILFVCHNVFPHERFPLDRWLTRRALKRGDCYIVQSKADEEDLRSIIKNPQYERTVHPTYNAFQFENMSRERGRELLEISPDKRVLLFFGFIREYKGLKHLIRALPLIRERLDHVRLLIVGDFGQDKQDYLDLIQSCNAANLLEIHDGYIPDREVEKYFAASDLVVLPYESATQSGIVQIAYGFEKPVIVTNVGGLPDVVTDGKTGYVVEPRDPEKLAEAIVKYFLENKEREFTEGVRQEAYRFSWDRMVETVERLG